MPFKNVLEWTYNSHYSFFLYRMWRLQLINHVLLYWWLIWMLFHNCFLSLWLDFFRLPLIVFTSSGLFVIYQMYSVNNVSHWMPGRTRMYIMMNDEYKDVANTHTVSLQRLMCSVSVNISCCCQRNLFQQKITVNVRAVSPDIKRKIITEWQKWTAVILPCCRPCCHNTLLWGQSADSNLA